MQFCRKYGGFRPRLATMDKATSLVDPSPWQRMKKRFRFQPAFISHLNVPNVVMVSIADAGATWICSLSGSGAKLPALRTLLSELNLKSQ